MDQSRDVPLDELPKEELVKKCKRLLLIAQKAKQAKDESSEELKKTKDSEKKLQEELLAGQEVIKTMSEKHERLTESLIKTKAIEEKLKGVTFIVSKKDEEIKRLQDTIDSLKEINSASEIPARVDELLELQKSYERSEEERKGWEEKALDFQHKLKIVEEKYTLLDVKLVDFQNKYLEERTKHAKLESMLGRLEEKAEKSGSERSESRADGLTAVAETEEVESLAQKLDESKKTIEHLKSSNDNLAKKSTILEKELDAKNVSFLQLKNSHDALIERCLEECREMSASCDKIIKSNDTAPTDEQRINDLLNQIESLERESLQLSETKNTLQERVSVLESENDSLRAKLVQLQEKQDSELTGLNAVIDSLKGQLEDLRSGNSASDQEFKALQDRFVEASFITEALNQRCEELNGLKTKVNAYDNVMVKLLSLRNDVKDSKQSLNALRHSVSSDLSVGLEDLNEFTKSFVKMVDDFSRPLAESNADLLTEMNMMNQALKERGETISALEESNSVLQGAAAENEVRQKKLSDKYDLIFEEVSSLRTEVDNRDKTIREMEEEMWRLRSGDTPGDALSTSTFSKVEESQRLSDLEESFEERYNKLKALAVKLKKKVIEQQNEIEKERAKLVGERADFQAKINALKTQAAALTTLQSEYDQLLDKGDHERKQAAELRKSLDKSREDGISLKQQLEEVKNEHGKFVQEKATFEMIKKELTTQIQSLKKSVEKEQGKVNEWELEKERWERELKRAEKSLSDEKERHKATLASLEEERLKQKKQSLLSLEMADYERTVKEMSRKLSVKDDQIKELTANLDTQRELSKTLQESVSGLESRVAVEQATADSSKTRQNSLQEEVSRLNGVVKELGLKISDSERIAQERLLELDAIKLELATVTTDQAKFKEKFRTDQENLKLELQNVDEKRMQLLNELERRDLQLTELNQEFDSYKVRAQSVLRQSQREGPPGRQLDIEQELAQIKAAHDITKSKLEEALKSLETAKQDFSSASNEKARLHKKVEQLENEVCELKVANSQLEAAEKRAQDACDEAIRMAKIQQDTLSLCYRREIDELEAKHRTDLDVCRLAQQNAETALQLHVAVTPSSQVPRIEPTHRRQHSSGFVPVRSERETLDVLMLEREACEGSESVESSSPRVVPLEHLLLPQQPSTHGNHSHLVEKLEKYESRIQHLTSLLSDAETTAAKVEQMNQVLKEEIRRIERNTAREEHGSNLEYLKNIVIKFATLPRGDERLRLVPVLNTILKFSREEEHRLCAAARGDSNNPGWGSYLGGMWTGT